MRHECFHWPDRTIGKRESRTIRESHNATVNALCESEERIRAAVEHITESLAFAPNVDGPNADALRIALGILLGSTTEATA